MRSLSDEKLAEALWVRSKEFSARGDFYNAIIDLGASYRLFGLAHDKRAEEVRLEWEKNYHQLISTEQETSASSTLHNLIDRVQSRKREPPKSIT